MKKLLVVGVIVLFLGLAFAPSINANISKTSVDSELVEFTTEVCGLKGGKHTVSLSKEEAEEVENLIDDIERRLDEVETREETVEIFNEAIVELDKYGLLGSLSVKQAQRLITGMYQDTRVMKFLEWIFNKKRGGIEYGYNFVCLIAGNSTETFITSPGFVIGYYLFNEKSPVACFFIRLMSVISSIFRPLFLCGFMCIGEKIKEWEVGISYNPAVGQLWTFGVLGKRIWDGSFYGQISAIEPIFQFGSLVMHICDYLGVIGFTGVILTFLEPGRAFYLGSSLIVNIGPQPPYP